jgi:hypothetical protein
VRAAFGESAERAVVSIGGASRFNTLTDDARPFVLKEFVKAFADFEREARARHVSATLLERTSTRRLAAGGDV